MLWPESSLGTEAWLGQLRQWLPLSLCGSAGRPTRTDPHKPGRQSLSVNPHPHQAALPPPAQRGPSQTEIFTHGTLRTLEYSNSLEWAGVKKTDLN